MQPPPGEAPAVIIQPEFRTLNGLSDIRRTLHALLSSPAADRAESSLSGALRPSVSLVPPRLLCVWDVDDTLVASGPAGVRQCPVFEAEELQSLFRSLRGRARHLLLSQGSIDDVFTHRESAQLSYLMPFFSPEASTPWPKAKKESGHCLCAGALSHSSFFSHNRQVESEEAELVRIAARCAPAEGFEDVAAMTHATHAPPRCPPEVRWLVMRPSLWGISLSSLSNLIPPSPNTAFLDGTIFRKMDIVRSLAASGLWDAVFFIDNNLSELGVVRPGLDIGDYYRMKAANELPRFFHSDILFLELSAKFAQADVASASSSSIFTSIERELPRNGTKSSGVKEPIHDKTKTTKQLKELATSFSFSEGCHLAARFPPTSTRNVRLVVAQLHLDEPTYCRITRSPYRCPGSYRPGITDFHQQPIFSGTPSCSDEAYEELMAEFRRYEKALLSGAAVPDWDPALSAVWCPLHPRPTRFPVMRHHYAEVCRQVTVNLVQPLTAGVSGAREAQILKETNHLYRQLIRRQGFIDPEAIAPLAKALFDILSCESLPTRKIGEEMKKIVAALQSGANNKLRKRTTKGKKGHQNKI